MAIGQYAALIVEIIIVATLTLNTYDGHALGDADSYLSLLGLVALGSIDKGAFLERLLNTARVDLRHGLMEWIDITLEKHVLNLGGTEEARIIGVGDINGHLSTLANALVGFVERGNRQDEIDGKQRVKAGDDDFLPRHESIWAICGT